MVLTAPAPTGYRRSLLACLVWAGFSLVMIVALYGPPPSADAVVRVLVSLLTCAALGAVAVWLVARRRAGGWPAWQLLALALPAFLLMRLVLSGLG